MPKAKVTDGQIIKAIKANPNMSNRAMAIELGLSLSGSTNSRINKLKAAVQINQQPDIQLYDTVTKDGIWYRVIGIDKDGFAVRRTDNNGDTTVVPRGDYLAGKTGFTKRDLPPVKTYIDPLLKGKIIPDPPIMPSLKIAAGDIKINNQPIKNLPDSVKGKIVDKLQKSVIPETKKPTINQEFEATVQELVQCNNRVAAKANLINKIVTEKPELEPAAHAIETELADRERTESEIKRRIGYAEDDYIDPEWGITQKPAQESKPIRGYLVDINQLLDLLIGDCDSPEMAEQTKKLICYKLVIGFKKELGIKEAESHE